MTAKQIWGCTALGTLGSSIVIGAIALQYVRPTMSTRCPSLTNLPSQADHEYTVPEPDVLTRTAPPAPTPAGPVAIAVQKAKLKLSDGRTATFLFSPGSGGLTCTAAIGLDEVLGYSLAPVGDPAARADPAAAGSESDCPPPAAANPGADAGGQQSARAVSLRSVGPDRSAAESAGDSRLAELRSYLDKHCPLESGCASGHCPLTASKTPSYRFLPNNADASRLTPVWQQP